MPFMLSDFLAGQQGMQEAIDTQQARQGLKDVYSNMPSADENGSQNPFQTQVGYLQKQMAKAGATGNVKLWQTLSKELDNTLDKQSKYDIRSANMAAKKQQAVGSAINGILTGMDEKTGYVPPETMKEIVSNLSESDPEKARNLWANYVQQGGVYTPEMQRGLKATLAQSMTAKDAATLAENQAVHRRLEKDSEARREYEEAGTALRRAEIANLQSGKTKSGGTPSGGQGKISAQERTVANTMTTAMSEAGLGIENLSQFTKQGVVHTTSGAYENLSDHGVMGATAKQIARGLTPQDKQMYQSIMLPLVRQAVTVQSGGRYKITESAVKQEMDAVMAQAGQSHMTMLVKMAELKQTILRGAEASLATGTLNEKQSKIVQDNMDKIEKAIPWGVKDVVDFYQEGGKAKDFKSWLNKGGSKEGTLEKPLKISSESEADKLPNGTIVIMNGKKFKVQH